MWAICMGPVVMSQEEKPHESSRSHTTETRLEVSTGAGACPGARLVACNVVRPGQKQGNHKDSYYENGKRGHTASCSENDEAMRGVRYAAICNTRFHLSRHTAIECTCAWLQFFLKQYS